jgi:hypothetical protein
VHHPRACLDRLAIDPDLFLVIGSDRGNGGAFAVFGHPLAGIGSQSCFGIRIHVRGRAAKVGLGVLGLALGDIALLQFGDLGTAGVFELLTVFGTDGMDLGDQGYAVFSK